MNELNFAKVNKETNIVENLEVVSKEWLEDFYKTSSNYIYVQYTDSNPAYILGTFIDGVFFPPESIVESEPILEPTFESTVEPNPTLFPDPI